MCTFGFWENDDDDLENSHDCCRDPRECNFAADGAERSADGRPNHRWLAELTAGVGVVAGMVMLPSMATATATGTRLTVVAGHTALV
jgi:hypothetical protein